MARSTGPDRATVELVWARSGGMCERCGIAPHEQTHHRMPRGAGGSKHVTAVNLPSNLVGLCAACHHHCEMNRVESRNHGWLVSRLTLEQPANVAVKTWRGWRMLNDDGSYSPLPGDKN